MAEKIMTTELSISQSHLSFLLPLSFDFKRRSEFIRALEKNQFTFFKLKNLECQKGISEDYHSVKAKELEQYFLPYIAHILFPLSLKDKGFHRYTKSINNTFYFNINGENIPFFIEKMDIIIGPFGILFLTIRVTLAESKKDLSEVLDFMHHFRTMEAKLDEEKGAFVIHPDNGSAMSIHEFLFNILCPFLKEFIVHDENIAQYFGTIPYIEDERMLVSAFLYCEENAPINDEQLFRMGTVDGQTSNGEIFISANNINYIRRFLKHKLHDRWAPNTYTVVTEHAFMTITNKQPEDMVREESQFMGTHYYNFLLHYFYKIMLIRVAYEYSKIEWEKDDEYVKSLIKFINMFSSLYYKKEVSTRSEGKELTSMFRNAFQIDSHFKEVNKTLQELYKSQENLAADRMNRLLFILTIFTVISGIYGMNLVIEDWKTHSGWKDFMNYTLFEWISLITAVTGIALSAYLVASTFGKVFRNKLRRKKSKYQMY